MTVALDTYLAMWRLMTAFRMSRAIGVAVELGIPELLSVRPNTASELAAECNAHEDSLLRLLRMLVAMEVLTENDGGQFVLTALGEELRSDRLGPLARFLDGQLDWKAWQHLDHSIKTGERAFDLAHGMRNWQFYAGHPADAAVFDAAMRSLSGPIAKNVAAVYDFSRAASIADVGGGDGTMLIGILRHHPRLRGILLDRPDVIERARKRFEEEGLEDRVHLIGGSFFDDVPAGADVYLMKSIVHDWDDEEAIAILQRCRAAASAKSAPVLVVERMLSDRIGPDDLDAVLSDLNMLVNPGGRERTTSEYGRLFDKAGLRLERTYAVGRQFHILEALPA